MECAAEASHGVDGEEFGEDAGDCDSSQGAAPTPVSVPEPTMEVKEEEKVMWGCWSSSSFMVPYVRAGRETNHHCEEEA